MAAPVILLYNMDQPRKLKLLFICSQLKIRLLSVPKADYGQPVGALAGIRPRTQESYAGEGFADEMLVMANFSAQLFQAFLNALRQNRVPSIALKAMLTPTNAQWNSLQLHDEILREHKEMHQKK